MSTVMLRCAASMGVLASTLLTNPALAQDTAKAPAAAER